jgi:hypothetical protein
MVPPVEMPPVAPTSTPGNLVPKSEPRVVPTLASLPALRLRVVAFEIWALSSMVTMTVRMSPRRWARWSLKKPLASLENSEFGLVGSRYDLGHRHGHGAVAGLGRGIGDGGERRLLPHTGQLVHCGAAGERGGEQARRRA